VVRLEIGPEQFAEQVGEALQRGEVDRELALGEVVDEDVAHRPAGQVVAVDELFAAGLAATGEDPQRGGRVVAEHGRLPQQLIEKRASSAPIGLPPCLAGEVQQLDAVPDGHLRHETTFGGQDARHTRQRLLSGLQIDRAGGDQAAQGGEAVGVTGTGHFERQISACSRRGEQERKTRPDHVRADHHQKTRGEMAERPDGARTRSTVGRVYEAPPVRRVLGAASQPPILPGLAWPGLQPAHDGQDPETAALLAQLVLQRERRREQPRRHRCTRNLGGWPRAGGRARRETVEEPGSPHRGGRPGHHLGGVLARHFSALPKRVSMLSAR